MSELIITNGDSAADLLREAGIGSEWLPWRDVLHEGPVPETADLASLSKQRAAYLASAGLAAPDGIEASFVERDGLLARNEDFSGVTLWFEHDLYDQLQLLQILDWFANHWRDDGRVFLVQADDYLGMQEAETIGRFAAFRTPVTGLQLGIARVAWTALRQPAPEAWAALLKEDLSALPHLAAAVTRMLEELPATATGLTRTQRETLKLIRSGVIEPRHLFGAYAETEAAKFMGDSSFFAILDDMLDATSPLIDGRDGGRWRPHAMTREQRSAYMKSDLRLTVIGNEVLAGREDYVLQNGIDRWWGGTHLTKQACWRWDGKTGALVGG